MAELITLDEAKQYLGFDEDDRYDEILTLMVAAGSDVFRTLTSRDFDLRAYVETKNGKATRSIRVAQRPIAATPAPTASENGTALVVVAGYSDTADVVVDLEQGAFHRMVGGTVVSPAVTLVPGVWSPGVQNIVLGFTAGYAAADVPADVKLFVKHAVAYFWTNTDKKNIGVAQRSIGQGSTTFLENLPEVYRQIAERRSAAMLAET